MPDKTNNYQCIDNGRKPATWDDFFSALKDTDVPADFLSEEERGQDRENEELTKFPLPPLHLGS